MQDDLLKIIHQEIKELRLEIKADLGNLEKKVDSKFLQINRDISSFKRFTFGVILTITSAIEAIKHKLGF